MHCSLQKGYTPLLIACEYEHVSVVKLILKEDGVDANQATKVCCNISRCHLLVARSDEFHCIYVCVHVTRCGFEQGVD